MPRFKLLPKVNSLRLAGKRYRPGDKIELTEEQASRFNPDIFAKIENLEPLPAAASPVTPEAPAPAPEKPAKTAAKRPGFARKPKQ